MMMSHSPSSLQQEQNMHRRQNSTPVFSEAMKVPNLPQSTQRPSTVHRRGHSFDQRSPIRRQYAGMVSTANLGSIQQQGHQILREAQQQRIARPGQQQIDLTSSPQCGMMGPSIPSGPASPYDNLPTMNAIMQHPNVQMQHSPYFVQDMSMPTTSSGLEGMNMAFDENQLQYFHQMQPMSEPVGMGLQDRRQSHPDMRVHTGLRPLTPTQQLQRAQFPLTPATTPFNRVAHLNYTRSTQSSPVKNSWSQDDIQSPHPISMQRGQSLQGIVETREEHYTPVPSPMASQHMTYDVVDVAEMPVPESFQCRTPVPIMSPIKSRESTPDDEDESLPFFDETGGEMAEMAGKPVPQLTASRAAGSASPTRPALSPRRMSISDLNLEPGINASIEETNVTLDDIAQYIEGPDPGDNRWICKFDDCNKRFGRKENIKSHVQTHLGDRQFRCDHCKKCFVRGHDLKRHAKIHTGTKPYPCLCGNSFARHDALTRHRQRGMCIGAFEGVVKKVLKRGRPPKHRPEMDERLDKAARTRMGHAETGLQYASSESSGWSSYGSPPTETMESLSIRGNSPFDDMNLFAAMPSHLANDNTGFPPNIFSFTPPASPGYSCGNQPSPSHTHRSLTPADLVEMSELPANTFELSANSMTLQISQHSHSLPSLSHSSSSPAADVAAYDFAEDQLGFASRRGAKMESDRNDFDNFLDYGATDIGFDPSNADNFFTL